MADSDNDSGGHRGERSNNQENSHREQDRLLPIANVSRIMKKGLPANAKISKDAKETVQECVSEFISFITGEASDKCQREKRKTINGDDLLWAMTTLGFEEYVEPLKVYLQRFRDMEGEKCAMAGGASGGGGGRVEREGGGGGGGGNGSGGGGNGSGGGGVNMVNSGVNYGGEVYGASSGMVYQNHPHQGHVYGTGVYGQVGPTGTGKVGSGNYVGSAPHTPGGRPR